MIIDAALLFSDEQAVTATAASANVLDLANARDLGIGYPLEVFARVGTAFAALTSLQVQFQGSVDNSTYTTYISGPAVAAAALVAGTSLGHFKVPRPGPGIAVPRYYRLNYVVAGADATAGTIKAGLVLTRHDYPVYPSGVPAVL